ncbi:MAG: hypothetical protein P8P30_04505 [Rickettsiales bacterium]|nr:hypothetical protein [Rickettsiales bacterium]
MFEDIMGFLPGGDSLMDIGGFLSGDKTGIQTMAGMVGNGAWYGQLLFPSAANKAKNVAKLVDLFGDGFQREDLDDLGGIVADGFVAHFGTAIFGDSHMGKLMAVGAGALVSMLVENLLHEFAHISPEASEEAMRTAGDKAIAKTMKDTADLTRTPEQMATWEKHNLTIDMSAEDHKKEWVADYVRDHKQEYQVDTTGGGFKLIDSQLKLAAEQDAAAKYAETFATQSSFQRVMTKDEYTKAGLERLGVYEELDAEGNVTNKAEIAKDTKFLQEEYAQKLTLARAEVLANGVVADPAKAKAKPVANPKVTTSGVDPKGVAGAAVVAGAAGANANTNANTNGNTTVTVTNTPKTKAQEAADEVIRNVKKNSEAILLEKKADVKAKEADIPEVTPAPTEKQRTEDAFDGWVMDDGSKGGPSKDNNQLPVESEYNFLLSPDEAVETNSDVVANFGNKLKKVTEEAQNINFVLERRPKGQIALT